MPAIDSLAAALEALRPGETYRFAHCIVKVTTSPLCGRYVIEGQAADQWRTTNDVLEALAAVDEFQDRPMPRSVETRHVDLLEAASSCYRRRDASTMPLAGDFEAIGDLYLDRASALLAEWTVAP